MAAWDLLHESFEDAARWRWYCWCNLSSRTCDFLYSFALEDPAILVARRSRNPYGPQRESGASDALLDRAGSSPYTLPRFEARPSGP